MHMTAATAADEILSTMNDGVLLVDPTNRVIRINPAAAHLLECSATQLVGQDVKDVLPGKDVSATQVLRQTDGGHADWLQETTLVTPSNRQLPLAISTSTVRDSLGQVLGVVMILRDISKQKENEEKLRMLAHHDALTQLPNRLLLRDRMTVATARARRYKHAVAVLLLDLDHFKEINDTLGHDYGDEVLRLFAARLLGCVRGHDTVARLGGDEFVIVAGELPEPATAEVVARRILSASERPLEVKGRQIFVTPSIGISVYERDAESVEDLLRLADIAMYESKNRQRNTFTFFETAMLSTVNKRAEEQADARGGST
jgi:diguanylate cyclase (GGDEF)-like protein/PAS domain S-box-containing protein